MTVRLRYDLTGSGWAQCELELDGQRVVVTASYLSDALDELCRAVVELLRDAPSSGASFDEEPGEYRWRFERVGPDRLRVRILAFPQLWGEQPDGAGQLLLDAECPLRSFAGALLSELRRLRALHGEAGYRERWVRHDFPGQRLAELEELLAGPNSSTPIGSAG